MSRSNYDKSFYVDVGTSVVAIRCASNHDIVCRRDHIISPFSIKLMEDACDRMNREAEIFMEKRNQDEAAKPRRNCDVGTAYEQWERVKSFCNKYRTGIGKCQNCPVNGIFPKRCALIWAQMPYENEVS